MRNVFFVLFIGMGFLFCLPAGAVAAEEEFEMDRVIQHMEIQEREMELDQRRSEMEHENQMRQLELQRQRAEIEKFQRHGRKDKFIPLVLLCLIVHILVAIWVYQDIHTRQTGSGIWIVIALLAGLPGALVYAVVRLGDVKKA